MNIINQMEDVDSLYQSTIIEHSDGTYECPVCHKIYKQRKAADKHYDKQDCYSLVDLVANTPYEDSAYGLYQSVIALKNDKARVSLPQFRKAKAYRSYVRFCMFCYYHEIDDFGLYYGYLAETLHSSMPNVILTKALNEETMREYRIFLHKNPSHVDSDEFWDRHGDVLLEDDDVFIRELEKAHITLQSVKKRTKAMNRLDKLPMGYQLRVGNLMDKVEKR